MSDINQSPLGKPSAYVDTLDASLLFPIPRMAKRDEIGIPDQLPFCGYDIWNGYELSWLNLKGKPMVAIAIFTIPCESLNIIESKSFKLYLNSFNNAKFTDLAEVKQTLTNDLSSAVGADVQVEIEKSHEFNDETIKQFSGELLDDLDIVCDTYLVQPNYLTVSEEIVEETLFSDLLKSNCLVTGQPDWGSVQIKYKGNKIDHSGLLKYIVSFRNHNEFHEQCVERIYMDILRQCKPSELTVYARYTRRGGLDINPIRSSRPIKSLNNLRLFRQ